MSKMYWITGILGLAFIVAPFVLGYSGNPIALWTSLVLGAAIAVVSGYQAFADKMGKWEYWAAGILGLLAVIAPFVLGFSALATALWTILVLGIVVAILAGYEVFF